MSHKHKWTRYDEEILYCSVASCDEILFYPKYLEESDLLEGDHDSEYTEEQIERGDKYA